MVTATRVLRLATGTPAAALISRRYPPGRSGADFEAFARSSCGSEAPEKNSRRAAPPSDGVRYSEARSPEADNLDGQVARRLAALPANIFAQFGESCELVMQLHSEAA